MGNNRFYLCHVGCRPYRIQEFKCTTLCRRCFRIATRTLFIYAPGTCRPAKSENKSWLSAFGLDALVLFKKKKMAIFFLFSMLLGAALQITNTYGDLFLGSFASIPEYADSFGVKHSVILLSISQMSETLFILAIPFFLRHFGIKQVMLISMFAWVFRFYLFGFGDPGSGTMDADPFHDCLWYGTLISSTFPVRCLLNKKPNLLSVPVHRACSL